MDGNCFIFQVVEMCYCNLLFSLIFPYKNVIIKPIRSSHLEILYKGMIIIQTEEI